MKARATILVLFVLFSSLTACAMPGGGGGGGATGGSAGNTGSTGTSGSGACSNPLYPVVENARWDYSAQSSLIGDYSFSHTIVGPLTGAGFSIALEISTGVSANMEWSCDSGDLIQMDAASGPAGALSTTGGTFSTTETENASGVTLPASVAAGDTWTQSYDIHGEVRLPDGTTGTGEGSYSASSTAIGLEEVTVPAGTFNAMRIEQTALYDLTVSVQGIEVSTPVSTSLILWFAPDVGLVKQESTNDFSGYEIIELSSYSIP